MGLSRNLIQRLQQPRQTAIGPKEKSGLLEEAASKVLFPGCPVICHVQSLSLRSDKTLPHISLCSAFRALQKEYFPSSSMLDQGIDPLLARLVGEAFTSVKDETLLCDKENTK